MLLQQQYTAAALPDTGGGCDGVALLCVVMQKSKRFHTIIPVSAYLYYLLLLLILLLLYIPGRPVSLELELQYCYYSIYNKIARGDPSRPSFFPLGSGGSRAAAVFWSRDLDGWPTLIKATQRSITSTINNNVALRN